jgi:hypothetical protein
MITAEKERLIRIASFEVVQFIKDASPVVLIYALGVDGVLYEMSGGRWLTLPITDKNAKTLAEVHEEQRLMAEAAETSNRGGLNGS